MMKVLMSSVRFIYTKIYDERQTILKDVGTPFVFQTYGGNAEEIASTIRDLYEGGTKHRFGKI